MVDRPSLAWWRMAISGAIPCPGKRRGDRSLTGRSWLGGNRGLNFNRFANPSCLPEKKPYNTKVSQSTRSSIG